MRFLRQFVGILRVNLSGAAQRMGSVLTIIVGVACAVGVLISMLAMGIGVQRQGTGDVRADRVILSSTGARGIQSSIPKDEAAGVRDLPGVKTATDGAKCRAVINPGEGGDEAWDAPDPDRRAGLVQERGAEQHAPVVKTRGGVSGQRGGRQDDAAQYQ